MMMLTRLLLNITCKINLCGQTGYLVFLGTIWYFLAQKGQKYQMGFLPRLSEGRVMSDDRVMSGERRGEKKMMLT